MRRDYEVRGWFWWTTIAACGLSFVVALDPATARETQGRQQAHAAPSKADAATRARARAPVVRRQAVAERQLKAPKPMRVSSESGAAGEPSARGLRRLAASEVSAEMLVIARRVIREQHRARPGTEIPFESGGQSYVARVERHYHPEGGPVKPWGYHPGVSLLKAR